MNKKLLSVMIGTALAGSISVAQADVQLYGQVDVSVDSHDCSGGALGQCSGYSGYKGFTAGDNSQKINMNGNFSYVGIKGSEDLGNGLKAIFNVMMAYDPAGNGYGGSNSLTDNEKWLGIASDFGTFRAGTVTTPYSDHGAMIDPFFGTSLEGNKSGLQSTFLHDEYVAGDFANGLSNRTIRLDSADMNGLSASLFYTMGGHSTSANPGGNTDNPYGLGAQYKNGNILAFADYLTDSVGYVVGTNSTSGTNNKAWDIGGQYTMGNIGLFGMYERGGLVMSDFFTGGDATGGFLNSHEAGANIWHVGGSFKMGNTLAYAAYGQGDGDVSGTALDEYTAWTLGVKHSLSVRTSLYAGYTNTDVDGNVGKTDQFGVGMNVKF